MEYATPEGIYIPGCAIKITLCQLLSSGLQSIIDVEQLMSLLGYPVTRAMTWPHIFLHY